MKIETYNKIVEKFGKERADEIKLAIDKHNDKTIAEGIAEDERLERMVKKMIPKEKLEGGCYYNGHRWRGAHIGMWDADEDKFLFIDYSMGDFYVEVLEHFEEVKDTNRDGFIPFEKINPIDVK